MAKAAAAAAATKPKASKPITSRQLAGAISEQHQLTKKQGVTPMTRDYIVHEEQRLRALEKKSHPPLRLAGE